MLHYLVCYLGIYWTIVHEKRHSRPLLQRTDSEARFNAECLSPVLPVKTKVAVSKPVEVLVLPIGIPMCPFNSRVMLETNAPVYFGLIPRDHWVQPAWVDEIKASESRERLKEQNIIYGGISSSSLALKDIPDSSSYRNMCRFNSGVGLLFKLQTSHVY